MTVQPVFDAEVLTRLARDVRNGDFVRSFAVRYRELLHARVERVTGAVMAADFVTAMDAVLSLKVSSSSVGTCELADLALCIEGDVRRLDGSAARRAAGLLPCAAERADRALGEYLAGHLTS